MSYFLYHARFAWFWYALACFVFNVWALLFVAAATLDMYREVRDLGKRLRRREVPHGR